MSEQQGFLTAIKKNPADHVTRRVYADWLEDHGEPANAAFLRMLLDYPTLTGTQKHELSATISADADKITGFGRLTCGYHYDRPEWTLTLDEFLNPANREELFLYAALTKIRITDIGIRMQELAASFHLRAVTKLDLQSNNITSDGAVTLAASSHLCNLTHLNLWNNRIGNRGAQALAQSPHPGRLTHLGAAGNSIGHAGAEAIAESPHMRRLTCLDLSHNPIDPPGARALAASKHLGNLTHLYLHTAGIGDTGLWAIANSRQLAGLTNLYLWHNGITDAGVQALAASVLRRNLTSLDLSHNNIRIAGARALADSEQMQGLAYLDMSNNPIGALGTYVLERMRTAAAGRGQVLELHSKHTPERGHITPAKGKWSRRALHDTDRGLSPAIP